LEGCGSINVSSDTSNAWGGDGLSARYNASSQDQNQQNATPCEGVPAVCDPPLKAIIEEWGRLPKSIRDAIHMLVISSVQKNHNE
jgi:hypothetical protein